MSDVPIEIHRITDASDPAMEFVERIYVEAIHASVRKPTAWVRGIVGSPNYQLLIAERAQVVLGFAIVFTPMEPADAALLEYLAVDGSARGSGIGTDLVRRCRAVHPGPLLVEIETADADSDRRRRFYERCGCRVIPGLQYMLPLPNAPPMGLMVAGAESIDRTSMQRWLRVIYTEVYGQQRDDPRIAGMVAVIGDP